MSVAWMSWPDRGSSQVSDELIRDLNGLSRIRLLDLHRAETHTRTHARTSLYNYTISVKIHFVDGAYSATAPFLRDYDAACEPFSFPLYFNAKRMGRRQLYISRQSEKDDVHIEMAFTVLMMANGHAAFL